MQANLKIVRAQTTDAEDITALTIRSKAYWNYPKEQIEQWRSELTISAKYIEAHQVFKLVKGKVLLGFYTYQAQNNSEVKLNFFFVEPAYIGKGYGKLLMLDFLERMGESDFKYISVDADPNAEVFYSKMGFQVIGQLESAIKDRFLPIMGKVVSPKSKADSL